MILLCNNVLWLRHYLNLFYYIKCLPTHRHLCQCSTYWYKHAWAGSNSCIRRCYNRVTLYDDINIQLMPQCRCLPCLNIYTCGLTLHDRGCSSTFHFDSCHQTKSQCSKGCIPGLVSSCHQWSQARALFDLFNCIKHPPTHRYIYQYST